MAEKYLWEAIRPIEQLADIATGLSSKSRELSEKDWSDDDQQEVRKTLTNIPVFLSTVIRRLDRQQEQILRLTQWMYQNIPEQEMLRVLVRCGIDYSELVQCYGVDPGSALSAHIDVEKEQEAANND